MKRPMILLPFFLAISIMCTSLLAQDAKMPKKLSLHQLAASPKIDGVITAGEWEQATKIDEFTLWFASKVGGTPKQSTRVYLGQTGDGLYIAFECQQKDPSKLAVIHKKHDANFWKEDSVEVYLDPGRSMRDYFQFALNAGGARRDTRNGDPEWNGDWKSAVKVHDDNWVAELFIPFSSLALHQNVGETWGVNFCRNDMQYGRSQWVTMEHDWHRPEAFGTLRGIKIDDKRMAELATATDVATQAADKTDNVDLSCIEVANDDLQANYVRIDKFGRTVIKQPGKKEKLFFPIGLFNARFNDDATFKQLTKVGFNTMQSYNWTIWDNDKRQRFADLALANDVMIVASLKDYTIPWSGWTPKRPHNPNNMYPDDIKNMAKRISEQKEHPAILTWYIADEPESHSNERCKPKKALECYKIVKKVDPTRPVTIAFTGTYGLPMFYKSYDVAMMDIYPFPDRTQKNFGVVSWYFFDAAKRLRNLPGKKPFWAVLQAYNKKYFQRDLWGDKSKTAKDYERLFPLYPEMRLMTFQALIADAKGILYYEYPQLSKPDNAAMARDLFKVVRELKNLTPVLLSEKRTSARIIAGGKDITGLWIKSKGQWYLLAANAAIENRRACIALPPGIAEPLEMDELTPTQSDKAEKVEITVKQNRLNIEFKPMAVHVIRIK